VRTLALFSLQIIVLPEQKLMPFLAFNQSFCMSFFLLLFGCLPFPFDHISRNEQLKKEKK